MKLEKAYIGQVVKVKEMEGCTVSGLLSEIVMINSDGIIDIAIKSNNNTINRLTHKMLKAATGKESVEYLELDRGSKVVKYGRHYNVIELDLTCPERKYIKLEHIDNEHDDLPEWSSMKGVRLWRP